MASRNLKKILRKIYKNAAEENLAKRTLNPKKYPVNFNRVIKYLNAQGARQEFNSIFKPLFKEMLAAEFKQYADGGHKISGALRKEMVSYVKDKAKQAAKAEIAARITAEQSLKEQKNVLAKG